MDIMLVLYAIHCAVVGGFAAFVAGEKNRDQVGWFILGFLFSFVALLSLIGVPSLVEKTEKSDASSAPTESSTDQKPLGYISDDGKEWVCACGTSNKYFPAKTIQNCSSCRMNRDFALGR